MQHRADVSRSAHYVSLRGASPLSAPQVSVVHPCATRGRTAADSGTLTGLATNLVATPLQQRAAFAIKEGLGAVGLGAFATIRFGTDKCRSGCPASGELGR
jgi:hypothetical protein